jgi:hypothetical protein
VCVESVHALLPGPLARLHPLDGVVERLRPQAAWAGLSVAAALDQPGALEHLQVTRDRGQADRERLGQLVDRRLAVREPGEDRAARGIGEGGEREVELVGRDV